MKNATTLLIAATLLIVVAACDKGRVCNEYGPKYTLKERCDDDEVCCPVGFETEGCVAGDHCPEMTYCSHQTALWDVCPGDAYCLYRAPPIDAGLNDGDAQNVDAGPGDGGVADGGLIDAGAGDAAPGDAGAGEPKACVRHEGDGCVDECPAEDICGRRMEQCCGEGTHCDQGCCVLD